MRTIKINIEKKWLDERPEAFNALRYIMFWAYGTNAEGDTDYDTLAIFHDGREDMIAHFSDTRNPNRKFTMGAVWREKEKQFTFHS